jgi:hypothetical protein
MKPVTPLELVSLYFDSLGKPERFLVQGQAERWMKTLTPVIDKHGLENVAKVIQFGFKDKFWASKLKAVRRTDPVLYFVEKYETIVAQMPEVKTPPPEPKSWMTYDFECTRCKSGSLLRRERVEGQSVVCPCVVWVTEKEYKAFEGREDEWKRKRCEADPVSAETLRALMEKMGGTFWSPEVKKKLGLR